MSNETEQLKRANELVMDAEKALSGGQTKWFVFKESPDYCRAAELFNEAGNAFKTHKAWKQAGDAYMRAAEADVAGGEPEEASRRHVNASSCYKKSDPAKAIEALQMATETFLKAGRFHLAATQEKDIAEIYESLLEDHVNAAIYFERAADRYLAEDAIATALGVQLKAGGLYAISENYPKAVEIFQAVVNQWAGDELKRFSMKDYLLRLGLTLLCTNDLVNARREIEKFNRIDSNFAHTHESTLLIVSFPVKMFILTDNLF